MGGFRRAEVRIRRAAPAMAVDERILLDLHR